MAQINIDQTFLEVLFLPRLLASNLTYENAVTSLLGGAKLGGQVTRGVTKLG